MNHQDDYQELRSFLSSMNLSEVESELKKYSENLSSKEELESAAFIMGVYINKLQEEFDFHMPALPKTMLPVTKQTLKKIGFEYAKLLVLEQGHLKRYQEDAALFYTSFQDITDAQWDHIINKQGVVGFLDYDSNFLPDFENIDVDIPDEYKHIIENKYQEKESAVIELHQELKKTLKSKSQGESDETQYAIDISKNIKIWLPWYFRQGFYTILTIPLFIFLIYCVAVSSFGALIQAIAIFKISNDFGILGKLIIFSIFWVPIMVPAIYYSLFKNFPGLWLRTDTTLKIKIIFSIVLLIIIPLIAYLSYHALGVGIGWLVGFVGVQNSL